MKRILYMLSSVALVFFGMGSKCNTSAFRSERIGQETMELTRDFIALGERVPGTAGSEKAQEWIKTQAQKSGYSVKEQSFTASTPAGPVEMTNLSYRIPGKSRNQKVMISAHYDSKQIEGITFLGANDAASAVALLIALSSRVASLNLNFDTEMVFFDGEEAFETWTRADSLYGSRNFASRAENISDARAIVVVDMVGDKDLQLIQSYGVANDLAAFLKDSLSELGSSELLESRTMVVEDDHVPFIEAGVPVLHLMDFTYGGRSNAHWHNGQDTMDNISADSLGLVGSVILKVLQKISDQMKSV